MKRQTASLLDQGQVDALITANFKDVFAVLGMHKHPAKSTLIARVLLPGAINVELISSKDNEKVADLNLVHETGLFEGSLGRRRKPFSYHLRVQYEDGVYEQQDPYRFQSQLDDDDLYLFCEGTQEKVYQWMGSHAREVDGVKGMLFVLWAPDAGRVSVVGEFNFWDGRHHVMRSHPASGVWEIFIPGVSPGTGYKYEIMTNYGHKLPLKADPYAFSMAFPPDTVSRTVSDESYVWHDQEWMKNRAESNNHCAAPVSIYEVHPGSWRRSVERDNGYLTWRELARQLIPYAVDMGFTHLQLMPVSEYPFDGSWGYQQIGMFSPTSRFGSPEDFKYFVDCCHQQGLGLLLDWVPGHFPADEYGIGRFDGTCLYEHEDVRRGYHPDWKTLIYNYGRAEVKSYLISNAIYWFDQYHVDGLRVDAVASMLYLDYSRKEGEWLPNEHGGRENLEAIEFLRQVNSRVYFNYPGAMMVAEESTAWPGVSRPVDQDGLGFGFKWNMGWMNDTLRYMERDPIHRQYHHNELTFGLVYAFSENFVLPLSHDEVVHGKRSLLERMPGDDWQKFANLRAYLGYMWTHPGKKLLFMGGEIAQRQEWNHDTSLDWNVLGDNRHAGIQRLVRDLNHCYRTIPALHQLDCDANGFEWIEADNSAYSIYAYLRKGHDAVSPVLVIVNMTPSTHTDSRFGVPLAGTYRECLNTDSQQYGGSNQGNGGGVKAHAEPLGGQPCQLSVNIPPLATLILERQADQ